MRTPSAVSISGQSARIHPPISAATKRNPTVPIITNATRDKEKIENFKGDKVMGTTQRWDQIIGRPDDTFWASFNYLPIEEALKNAVEEMKRAGVVVVQSAELLSTK